MPIKPSAPNVTGSITTKGSVPIALLVIFLDLLGFGIVLPTLPYITEIYGVPDALSSAFGALGFGWGANAVVVGLLSFCFSFPQFLLAPVWGSLSDRIGRKPVLSLSLGGYCVSWVAFALAPSLWWLLGARLLAGITAANISTAQAYIADVYPPEQRSKGMGLVGAAFGLGFTLGPVFGAAAARLGVWIEGTATPTGPSSLIIQLPIYLALGLTLLAFLGAVFVLPESLPPELRGVAQNKEGRLRRLLRLGLRPVLGQLLLAFFIVTFGFAVLEVFYSEFNRSVLELPVWTNALVFSVIGVVIVVVQGGLTGRLTKRFGAWKLLMAGMFLMGLSLLAMPFISGMTMLIIVSVVLALGNSLCNPSLLAIISRSADPSEQGAAMGSAQSVAALGRILGPLMGAGLWAWGAGNLDVVDSSARNGSLAAFWAGGGLILLALTAAWGAYRRSLAGSWDASAPAVTPIESAAPVAPAAPAAPAAGHGG